MILLFILFLFNQSIISMEVERHQIESDSYEEKCNQLYDEFKLWKKLTYFAHKKPPLQLQLDYLDRIHNISEFLYANCMDEKAYEVAQSGFKLNDPQSYLLASQAAPTSEESIDLLKKAIDNSSRENAKIREDAIARLEFEAQTNLDILDYVVKKRLEDKEVQSVVDFFQNLMPDPVNVRSIQKIEATITRIEKNELHEVEDELSVLESCKYPQYRPGYPTLQDLYESKAWKRLCDEFLLDKLDIKSVDALKGTMQKKMMREYYHKCINYLENNDCSKVFETCIGAEGFLKLHKNSVALKLIENCKLLDAIKISALDNPALGFVLSSLYICRANTLNYLFSGFSSLEEQVEQGIACMPSSLEKSEKLKERLLYEAGLFYKKQGILDKAVNIFGDIKDNHEACLNRTICAIAQQYTYPTIDKKIMMQEIGTLGTYLEKYPNMSCYTMRLLTEHKVTLEEVGIAQDSMIKALTHEYERGCISVLYYLNGYEMFPACAPGNHFTCAADYFQQKKFKNALEELELVDPKSCKEFYYFRGLLYECLDDYENAVFNFQKELEKYKDRMSIAFVNEKQFYNSLAKDFGEQLEDMAMTSALVSKLELLVKKTNTASYARARFALNLYEKNLDHASYKLFSNFVDTISKLSPDGALVNFFNEIYQLDGEIYDPIKWKVIELISESKEFLTLILSDDVLSLKLEDYLDTTKNINSQFLSSSEKQAIYNCFCKTRKFVGREIWYFCLTSELAPYLSKFNRTITSPYEIATLYLDGITNLQREKEIEKALEIFERDACEFNSDESLEKLVALYENGYKKLIKKDPEKAITFMEELAYKKYRAWATEKLGMWYRTGFERIKKDPEAAKRYFEWAFAQGRRFKELCLHYLENSNIQGIQECLKKLEDVDSKILQENVTSMCGLAVALLDSYKNKQNQSDEYLSLIEKCLLLISPSDKPDYKIEECFNKILSCEGELFDDIKWILLRVFYKKPQLFYSVDKKNFYQTLSDLKKTVNTDSFIKKSQKIELEYAFMADKAQSWALELITEISPQLKGTIAPTSALEVAEFYLEDKTNKPRQEAIKKAQTILLKDANEFGQFWSLKKLVKLYEEGFETIPKNPKGAFSLLSSLAKKENASALFLLSDWYRYGRSDCDLMVDKQKAGEYLEKAYKLDPELAGELGTFYFEQESYDKAFNFLSRSSLTSFGHSCMAMMYLDGRGTKQSFENFFKSVEKLVESKWDDRVRLYLPKIRDSIVLKKISHTDLQAHAKKMLLLGELYFMEKKQSRTMKTTCDMIRDYFTFVCKNGSFAQQCKAHIKSSETYFLEIEQDKKFSVDNFERAIAEYVKAIEILSASTINPHHGSQVLASDFAKVYLQIKEYKELLEDQKNIDPQQKERILVHWKIVKECADELQLEVVAALEMSGCQVCF